MHPDFNFWVTLVLIAVVVGAIQGACAYGVLLERKIAAWTQDRLGPNRVGPWGLLQPIADGLKFLFKEELIPAKVDKLFYLAAPAVAISTALFAFAVVPFGQTTSPPTPKDGWPQTIADERKRDADEAFQQDFKKYNETLQFAIAPHLEVGAVFVFAVGSLGVYAAVLGGWSSNNKFSFLGALRSSAQLISYEIPMGLGVVGIFLVTGSLSLERIIDYQDANGWNILFQPLACLLFLISILAECNRLPFDLAETEQELVGGYHTEYSALKLGLFLLGEYAHMITTSFLLVILFFGGWQIPWLVTPGWEGPAAMVVKLLVIAGKVTLVVIFTMVLRWTVPRFRFDQLMSLAWKVLMPLGLVNLFAVILVQQYRPLGAYSHWLLLPLSLLVMVVAGFVAAKAPREPSSRLATPYRGHGTGKPLLADDRVGAR